MTALEFRAKGEYRNALADILSNEVLQQAIAIITADDIGKDVPLNSKAIASVRLASNRAGKEQAFTLLQELTMPIEDAPKQPLESFGTEHTIEDFDNPEPDK